MQEECVMYTIENEGKLNNDAIEPTVYPTSYPTVDEQQQDTLQAAIAALLIVALVLIGFAPS
jgi:hypothetical protein